MKNSKILMIKDPYKSKTYGYYKFHNNIYLKMLTKMYSYIFYIYI